MNSQELSLSPFLKLHPAISFHIADSFLASLLLLYLVIFPNIVNDLARLSRLPPPYFLKADSTKVRTIRTASQDSVRLRSKKEVFQPHLPVRLPCYDLAPVTGFALGRSFRSRTSGTPGSHGLTGGVYKARERIHRAMADARLLANPASWSRVADSSPNWDRLSGSAPPRGVAPLCTCHCNTCVAPDVRAVLI